MSNFIEIFFIGLLGSMHCIGMCGGFVAMYSLKKPATKPTLPYHILYNLGRITTYSLLGGILGSVGSFFAYIGEHRGIPGAVLLIAGSFMVLMGLNIAGVLGKRGLFEENGITGTSAFRQTLHRILALESVWSTFLLGLLLGFLPCGLLYPIFMNAAASGGFISGMLIMAIFGIGTVPAMMSFGLLMTRLRPHIKQALYRAAAVLIVILGLQTFLRGMAFNGWIPMGRFW
ncbi:MAG: sulfite exporter TauE/SafE family protein [Nitrospirae bacterium]|nr:sulfite exporter TauE/SafE family protein [Nitrospirota bacterium]